jgi:hypothetical protein
VIRWSLIFSSQKLIMILSVATCRLQIIFPKDDQAMRELLVLNEYKPVLEICTTNVAGAYFKYPTQVSDGVTTMLLRSSFRKPAFYESFFSKQSPLYSGKMKLGIKIRLVDYTTSIWVDRKGSAHLCGFVEKMAAEPKSSCRKQKNE